MNFETRIINYEVELLKLFRNTDRWKNYEFSDQFLTFVISYTKNKSANTVIILIYKYVYYKYKTNASIC